ncbi:NADH-ubiquinone oxidoreductase chain M [Candidatus Rhodobacter oscarellae]|uniref:NADH-ubiquinone oxidoreductase chain M n=1 Tax=Candidatus Rhodobacter oscarellae TaxID=1675527 RepID=A0A0J9H2M7_9RHOB|nr:NADH-quinone oxidoreductase subunit M [Candidatus Rhodobacter lobularis]KMW59928.1 NADH-ubiquinone oxidoreductase chain M [Candidatus Rhodobacter lobularis]
MTEVFATEQIGIPILTLMILLPLLAVGGLYAVRSAAQQRMVALGAAGGQLLLGLIAVIAYDPSAAAATQLVQKASWMPALGASFHLGVDGISVLFLPLTALVIGLAMVSGAGVAASSARWFWTNLLLLQAAAIGVYTALDMVLFFLFWELMLIPSYYLIRLWGVGPARNAAAMKYVLYMLMGSVPLLVAIAALGANYGSFSLVELSQVEIPFGMQTMIFALLFIGFAVKAPLPPFHTWLPTVAMEGPAGIAIFLVGLKMGTFGMIKVLLPIAPDVALAWQPVLVWIGIAAMLYAGVIALAQTNMRRMLAYASVSHVGLVVAGIFTLNAAGLQGAVMAMVNFGLASTVLMLLAGGLYQRLGTTELTGLGGIARHAPLLAVAFFVAGLASIGMPGTSGFQGEFALLSGVFSYGAWAGAVALLGVILGAGYILWFYERAFFGPAKSEAVRRVRDLNGNERWGAGIAVACALVIGLAPMLAVPTVSGTTDQMASALQVKDAPVQTALVVEQD